jgi:hypothetical protein
MFSIAAEAAEVTVGVTRTKKLNPFGKCCEQLDCPATPKRFARQSRLLIVLETRCSLASHKVSLDDPKCACLNEGR